MQTIRKQIIDLLSSETMCAIDLSQELGIKEKDVYDHLPHIARTVGVKGKRLLIEPAKCLGCGYSFKDRKRFTPPGRCPKCRETHIQSPSYKIHE